MQSSQTCRSVKPPWVTGLCHQGREPNHRLKLTGAAIPVPPSPRLPRRPRQLSLVVPASLLVRVQPVAQLPDALLIDPLRVVLDEPIDVLLRPLALARAVAQHRPHPAL